LDFGHRCARHAAMAQAVLVVTIVLVLGYEVWWFVHLP
jgi:hypothetical protein